MAASALRLALLLLAAPATTRAQESGAEPGAPARSATIAAIALSIKSRENLDVHVDKSVLENVKQLKEVEETELACQTQTKYLEEVSSMTDISVSSLKRISNEGKLNNCVFSTPGKKRPHKATVSNLDSFDIQAIRNKINEFYIVKKQVPTLRCLLAELRESIGFTGCLETLRRILMANGYEFKQNTENTNGKWIRI